MRILFVKLSSIGDIVHTLPAMAAVKRALSDSEITWVVEKSAAEILRNNSSLFWLIELDTKTLRRKFTRRKTIASAQKQLRKLRTSEFDLVIDFQGLFKSALISKFAKTKHRFGFSKRNLREPLSSVFLKNTIDVEPKQHIVLKNLSLAEKSLQKVMSDKNLKLDRENLEFPISTETIHKKEASDIKQKAGGRFAILNPAGGWATKLWPPEKYGQLTDMLWDKLGMSSIISTAPNEINLAKEVHAFAKSGKAILAQPSLKGFYELSKGAEIYVGGDTAPTHLAVAAKCPVVGIFGPTEWWRNGSTDHNDICVERNDIDCRVDCHRRTCDKWICMDISVETVFDAVKKRLK